jgi:hypothetical protein
VTKHVRGRYRYASPDRDHWSEPGTTPSLLLVSGAMVLWWAISIVAGPIWLALHGQGADIVDHAWDLGDGR